MSPTSAAGPVVERASDQPRVLVVDDDPGTAAFVRLALRAVRAEVLAAPDGEAGLDLIRGHEPDLVILDWLMPRLSGLEVCRSLRATADQRLAAVPVLLLTSRSSEPDVEWGYSCGATLVLAKPASAMDLAFAVDTAIALRRPGLPRPRALPG